MLHSMIADTHTHVAIFSIKSSSHSKFASSLTTHRALLHNLIRRNKDVAVHGSFFFRRVTFPHTLLPYLSSDYLLDSRLICPRSKSTNHIPFGNVTNKGRPRALMPDTQAEPSGYPSCSSFCRSKRLHTQRLSVTPALPAYCKAKGLEVSFVRLEKSWEESISSRLAAPFPFPPLIPPTPS
jgi:hypothetical protein